MLKKDKVEKHKPEGMSAKILEDQINKFTAEAKESETSYSSTEEGKKQEEDKESGGSPDEEKGEKVEYVMSGSSDGGSLSSQEGAAEEKKETAQRDQALKRYNSKADRTKAGGINLSAKPFSKDERFEEARDKMGVAGVPS